MPGFSGAAPAAANSGILHFMTVNAKSMPNREIKVVENYRKAFQFADAHACRGIIREQMFLWAKTHLPNISCQTYVTFIEPVFYILATTLICSDSRVDQQGY